jgi:hypothetical protein
MVIFNMRKQRPAYNLISNNCQNFATLLLDKIIVGAHREFATAFAVYKRATGAGKIRDLFIGDNPEEQEQRRVGEEPVKQQHQSSVQAAQQVMEENTTKLDNHHSFFSP